MKNLILITSLLVLASCAKENSNTTQQDVATTTPSKDSVSIEINSDTCLELQNNMDANYLIKTTSDIYAMQDRVLYVWNTTSNQLEKLSDSVVTMSDVCKVTIENEVVSKIEVVQKQTTPSCGGAFQSPCAPVYHQPYVCGPNGQMCY